MLSQNFKNAQNIYKSIYKNGWVFLFIALVAFASACKTSKPQSTVDIDSPLLYKDTANQAKSVKKDKGPKRGVYYGIKTRKAFTKVVKNKKRTYELFHVLAKPQDPQPYVQKIHWFHTKKRKIFIGPIPEKEAQYAKIIHGPYQRIFDRKVIEEGIFYLGAKHGRWETYANNEEAILNNKEKWYKGFPKESQITYYDAESRLIKEVIPVMNGSYHGDYYYFSEKGDVLATGQYDTGYRVGQWLEYHPNTKRKTIKKKIQYPEGPWVPQFEGYVTQEFDERGVLTYDKETEDAKKAKAAKEAEANAEKK